ncbi:TadE family type IV pilus minor pilin [Microterricola pindariensis]|uniref:TadE-like domain-containing protein n=1 Tax=Microterricola pindariensis TaxID=478010 RepID=A0ABX5AYG1_9MICO|nr:TadE family type IV pilus minor pilin [Microterricola pindariensis]PPL19399.1 hypothetical protein GY24_06180 [Microterricola pindariensis]
MRSPWGRAPGRRATGSRGSVTAEFAVVMPALFLVLALCLGAVSLLGQQLRLSDAAADAARAAGRGDDGARVLALVARAVPGASLGLERRGEFVCAELSSDASFGPAGFGLRLTASSCALAGGL